MSERRALRERARTGQPEQPGLMARIATSWLRVKMIGVLGLLPFALRFLPVARIVSILTPGRPPSGQRPELLYPCAWWVDWLVDRRPFRFWGHCLRRSLALYYVATRAGYPVRVVLGIRRDGERNVLGHGWLELEGVPFMEPEAHPEERFVVMHRLPAVVPAERMA